MAANEARQRAMDYLRAHHVATLATMAADGPWAAAVFYVNAGSTLYFLSAPGTRHCRNLEQDARAAATVQADYSDWPAIRGVQLEGVVGLLAGAEEGEARRLYAEKFPLIGKLGNPPDAIADALARVRWYRLKPSRMYFIDNSVAFGNRDEIDPG